MTSTRRTVFGQPLLRLTYNFTDNDRKIARFVGQKAAEIGRLLNATTMTTPGDRALGDYSIVPYQSTHNTGGAIMGATPRDSVGGGGSPDRTQVPVGHANCRPRQR